MRIHIPVLQVANRNSLSVRMDEIKFGQFISANIGFFAASYFVFYPAELLSLVAESSL
jgi:endo-1,4-beta-D-glucanase Y